MFYALQYYLGVDCRRDPRLCDANADCVLNVDTFICVCRQGYMGDGNNCQRMSDFSSTCMTMYNITLICHFVLNCIKLVVELIK